MNSSKLADYSEIISSIAILITLVFLTIQMQQNTKAIEATARQGAYEADAQQIIQIINHPDISIAYSKPELTDVEAVKLHFSLILYFRNRESEWAQYKDSVLDEASQVRIRSSLNVLLQYERIRNWWLNHGTIQFDPGFVTEVNAELPDIPIVDFTREERLHSVFSSPEEHKRFLEANSSYL